MKIRGMVVKHTLSHRQEFRVWFGIKIPDIDLSHIILFHRDQRDIILIILIPADPQQRLIGLIQNIAFAQIPTVEFPTAAIGAHGSENIGVR